MVSLVRGELICDIWKEIHGRKYPIRRDEFHIEAIELLCVDKRRETFA